MDKQIKTSFFNLLSNIDSEYFFSIGIFILVFVFLVFLKNKILKYVTYWFGETELIDRRRILPSSLIILISGLLALIPLQNADIQLVKKYLRVGILSIVLFQFFKIFSHFYKKYFNNKLKKVEDKETKIIYQYLSNTILFTISIIGVLVLVDNLGVDVSAIVASLGFTGVAIAFGTRKIIFDLISSIIIILDKPFLLGDYIKMKGNWEGFVEKIGIRSVHLRGQDNQKIVIPNGAIVSNTLVNYGTSKLYSIFLDIELELDEDADYDSIKIIRKSLKNNFDGIKSFNVVTKEISENSKIIEVQLFYYDNKIKKEDIVTDVVTLMQKYQIKFKSIKLILDE
jgi:small-conductance mechanosensitive channel